MSQNIPDESQTPTEQPTSADLIGKMTDATEALLTAQENLVKAAADVAKHTTDPNAHGAATLANIVKALPTPVLEDGMFTFKDAAGKPLMEPVNIKGETGAKGDDGEKGDMPAHRWNGTALQVQNPDGSWGEAQDLQGPKGIDGADGAAGLAPVHEWDGTSLKFKNPDGSWGEAQDLQGPKGIDGADGAAGLAPAHEWDGTSLKFKNPDGSWGEAQDLQGQKGDDGDAAIATDEQPGVVQPDGVTTTVNDAGLLSALGGNLLLNDDEWITESCEWTAKVDGWHEFLVINAGWGACLMNGYAYAGRSGASRRAFIYLHAGEEVDVTIGAGGATTFATRMGGKSSFGDVEPEYYSNNFAGIQNFGGGTNSYAIGGGPGGSPTWTEPPAWYGGGGGGHMEGGNAVLFPGYQGAVHVCWHDPAKAAGPLPAPALLSARRMAIRATGTPATVNLYDPETGQGSVWREEDVEAKLAEGLLSEEAWLAICAQKAAEDYAEWLANPETEAERFALLRRARKARLAEYDTAVAQLRREERGGADVAEALAAWDAYANALCALPQQPGAPWDGGGELTPWPEMPTVAKTQGTSEESEQTEEPEV